MSQCLFLVPRHLLILCHYLIKEIIAFFIIHMTAQNNIFFLFFSFSAHGLKMTRPENKAPPANIFYAESKSYAVSSRMNVIQTEITEKCISFLNLEKPSLILDLGCGTGMSGRELARHGHHWVGCDISKEMLLMSKSYIEDEFESNTEMDSDFYRESGNIKKEEFVNNDFENYESKSGDSKNNHSETHLNPLALINLDISDCIPFKTGIFDAFISVSCFQWLFHNRNIPESRKIIRKLFTRLRDIVKFKGKGVIQFYSQHSDHTQVLVDEAIRIGFVAELLLDGEGKKRKQFLLLDCTTKERKIKKTKKVDKVREKIAKMKERRIKKGLSVSRDSKYSGRKRCKKFI